MKKLFAVLLAVTLTFSFAACTKKTDNDVPQTYATTQARTEVVTDAEGNTSVVEATTTPHTTLAPEEAAEKKMPVTPEEILKAYSEVVTAAKEWRPAYSKVEYQELPDDAESRQLREGAGLVGTLLNLAGNFMTTKEKALSNPEVNEKGSSMRWFPVYKCDKGCYLTDASAIKSAKCEALPDGNYKITIVLKPESNPEPCPEGGNSSPSYTGGVFNPLSRKEIDDTFETSKILKGVVKELKYDLGYHDCTAVLVYNPTNNHIVSLDHHLEVTITGSGKLLGKKIDLTQELINTMSIYDMAY